MSERVKDLTHVYLFQVIPGLSCALLCRNFWKVQLYLLMRRRLLVHIVPSSVTAGHVAGWLSSRWRWWWCRLWHRVRVQKQEVSRGSWRPVPDWLDEGFQCFSVFRADPTAKLLHLSDVGLELLPEDKRAAGFLIEIVYHRCTMKCRKLGSTVWEH